MIPGSKNKILVLSDLPLPGESALGGVQSIGAAQLEVCKKSKFEYDFISFNMGLSEEINISQENASIKYIPAKFKKATWSNLTISQLEIIKEIKKCSPAIVHANQTAPMYGFTASLSPFPYIVTIMGVAWKETNYWSGIRGNVKSLVIPLMERYAINRSDAIFGVSQYSIDEISMIVTKDIPKHVIYPSVDNGFFELNNNPNVGNLLFVGFVEPRKNISVLLRAIKLLEMNNYIVTLDIIGQIRDPLYYKTLKKYIIESEMKSQINFLTGISRDDLLSYMESTSIFILPSYEESLGIALVEAMAAHKACVASDIGEIPNIIQPGVNGEIFQSDDEHDLYRKIRDLLDDDEYRKSIGENAHRTAKEHFSLDAFGRRIETLYSLVIDSL